MNPLKRRPLKNGPSIPSEIPVATPAFLIGNFNEIKTPNLYVRYDC